MKLYTSVLINPFLNTCIDYNFKYEDFKSFYKPLDCSTFTIVRIGEKTDLFIDDEGLDNKGESQRYFGYRMPNGTANIYAGYGLILGNDEYGETLSAPVTAEEVRSNIIFHPTGEFASEEGAYHLKSEGFHLHVVE